MNSDIYISEHLQITDFVTIWPRVSQRKPIQKSQILSHQYFGSSSTIGQIQPYMRYLRGLNGNISAFSAISMPSHLFSLALWPSPCPFVPGASKSLDALLFESASPPPLLNAEDLRTLRSRISISELELWIIVK